MIRPDIAIAVWRRASAELGCSPPLKGQQWGRHGGRRAPHTFEQRLDFCQARNAVPCRRSCLPCLGMRIARQSSLLELFLLGDVRERSQVLVQTDRANQTHDVRRLCARGRLVVFVPFSWADALENGPVPNSATATAAR